MTRVPAFSKLELPALLTAGAYALLLLAGSIHARSLAGGLTAVLLVCGFLCGRFARKGKAVLPLVLMVLALPTAFSLAGLRLAELPYKAAFVKVYWFHSALFGGLLAAGCLAAVHLLADGTRGKGVRWAAGILGALLLAGLILSQSRTAILGAAAGLIVLFADRIPRKYRIALAVGAVIALTAGGYLLYRINPDSFKGRLLVWQVSGTLVREHPVLGSGIQTFPVDYPFAQGAFFQAHPDAPGIRFADDINRPYNDWLRVLVEQGIFGLLLLLTALFFLFRTSWKVKEARLARAVVACICIFALSSYPVESAPVLLATAVALGALSCVPQAEGKDRAKPVPAAILLAAGLVLVPFLTREWNRDNEKDREAQAVFRSAKPAQAVGLLEKYSREIPSSQLFVDLGDTQLKLGREEEALASYRTAAWMVPRRLTARYRIFFYYRTIGDRENAVLAARDCLRYASCYIPGPKVDRMLGEVRAYLNGTN